MTPWRRRALLALFVAVVVGFGWFTGVRGIDYGKHWDEWHQRRWVQNSIDSMDLLSRRYIYNGVYTLPGYLYLVPDVLERVPDLYEEMKKTSEDKNRNTSLLIEKRPKLKQLQRDMHAIVANQKYMMDMRKSFLAISLSLVVFAFFSAFVYRPRGQVRWLVPVVATLFVGTSFEVAYHARWIAVDSPQAAFTALTLLGVVGLSQATTATQRRWWAIAAGVGAGLAMGCKITGGSTWAFAMLGAVLTPAFDVVGRWQRHAARAAAAATAFFASMLALAVTTPGIFVDPFHLLSELAFADFWYNEAASVVYVVESKPEYLLTVWRWLTDAVSSPWKPVALALICFAIPGAVSVARNNWRLAVSMLALVVVHELGSLSSLKLVVRNHLVLVPIAALLVAVGVDAVYRWLRSSIFPSVRVVGVVVVVAVVSCFVANAGYMLSRATKVRDATLASITQEAVDWIDAHDDKTVYVTPNVIARAGDALACKPPLGVTKKPKKHDPIVFAWGDSRDWRWKAGPGFTVAHFGPGETNYDWYPTFQGVFVTKPERPRIAVVELEEANALSIGIKHIRSCKATGKPVSAAPSTLTPAVTNDLQPDVDGQ